MDRKVHEKEHGERIAAQAESVWGWSTPAGQQRARRRADLLIKHGQVGPGRAVLEIGCGTGLFSRYLSETGAKMVVSDLSWDLIDQVETGDNTVIRLVLSDAERLPFPSGVFDAVVGSSILHHLAPEVALAEGFRVLCPGGSIAFAEPNMLNPQIAIQKNIPPIKRWLGDSPDERAFFRWQAVRLLQSAGFEQVSATPHDFLHPLTPTRLILLVKAVGRLFEKLPLVREIAGSLIIVGRKPD
ncbi:MAG: methyltransferase domain-containing protein [Chloroflexi bacterium]|nr:methyltransferase domain-containing protein [Chloroflexota bacterium]